LFLLGLAGCGSSVTVTRTVTPEQAARFAGQVDVLAIGEGTERREIGPDAEVEKVAVLRVEEDGREVEAGVRYRLRTPGAEPMPIDARTPVEVRGRFQDGDALPGGGVARRRIDPVVTTLGVVVLTGVPVSLIAWAACLGQPRQPLDFADIRCGTAGGIGAGTSALVGGVLLGVGLAGSMKIEGGPQPSTPRLGLSPVVGPGMGGAVLGASF
jgi:hypothetical protein